MTWREFIESRSAQISVEGYVTLPSSAGLSAPKRLLIPLLHRQRIRISGPDALEFLQGQLSADVRKFEAGKLQFCSFNSPKGRMLAVFLAWREGDDVVLETETSVAEATAKRLKMYVLRAQVTVSLEPDVAQIGLIGPLPGEWSNPPHAPLGRQIQEDVEVIRWPAVEGERWVLSGPLDRCQALWTQWAALDGTLESGTDRWRAVDVQLGLPTVHTATQDLFVAQMANLDRVHGLSFTKGCYTGQEVIARLHYRGQVKRELVSALCDEAVELAAPVYMDGEAQPAGEIADVAALPGGGARVGMVIRSAALDAGALHVGAANGPPLRDIQRPDYDWISSPI